MKRRSQEDQQQGGRWELWLLAGSLIFALLMVEAAGRVWVALRWSAEDIRIATETPDARGGYREDPLVGYSLVPDAVHVDAHGRQFTHNALGLRSTRMPTPGDSVLRVLIVGASTVYGIFASDHETSSAVLEDLLADRYPNRRIEVFNAGVPNYTTLETARRLPTLLEAVDPDIVFLVEGRNELLPQLYNGYTPNYSHFRDFTWTLSGANRLWRRLFHWSHAAMVIVPNGAGVLGYSTVREHPVLGNIRLENRPNMEEMRANSRRPDILDGLRINVAHSLDLIAAHGATPVVVEMPFHGRKWAETQTLPRRSLSPEEDQDFLAIVSMLVTRNNSTSREIARERGVLFLETGALVQDNLMSDDCHFNVDGERAFAELLFNGATAVIDRGSIRR